MARDTQAPRQAKLEHDDSHFFRSKFRAPAEPHHFVRRPRLVRLLDGLSEYPVTLLTAPAGAGKTALAGDWARHTGRRAVWLALDEADRRPDGFVTALAAALDELAPGCASATLEVVGRPHAPHDAVHALVDALEDAAPRTEHAVLVVDDLHVVDDDERAVACLGAFVEHKPDWLDLVLLSRRRPALAVDRLRAAGVLADLTFDALRLTDAEAQEMFRGLCPDTSPDVLDAVTRWAGGWAAAVRLAALAVRSQRATPLPDGHDELLEAAGPAGAGRLVDEYLWHEVLRAERPELVAMLQDVCVVGAVSYPLAEALSGRPDAGDLLTEAERRGLFVADVEPGGWFELHPLVRTVLRAELERRRPDRLRERHARAARWYQDADDSAQAVTHWLAAGRPRDALRLLATLAVDLLDGERQGEIREVLDRLQPTLTSPDLDALTELAWCQLLVDRVAFDATMAAAEATVRDHEEVPDRLMFLRAAAAAVSGDWRGCEELARAALAGRGDAAWPDGLGRFGWSLVAHAVALDERWLDSGPEVGRIGRAVSTDPRRARALEGTRALGLALAGHPLDALRTARAARPVAEAGGGGTTAVEIALAEAVAARELGERDPAREQLERLAARSWYPSVHVRLVAQLELVELHLSDGDVERARAALAAAVALGEAEQHGPGALGALARRAVQVEIARRDLDAAELWARRVADPFWRPASEARILLARRDAPRAAEQVALAVPRSARHQVVQHLLTARAVREAERGSAEKEVAMAVEIAAATGMLATVGDEAREVLDLLELASWRVPDGWMDRLRVVAGGGALGSAPGALVDELTAREAEVLRLLPTRLMLREIAAELFVSTNTLKFHLRAIYQKLGVSSRAEAVEAARRLGLMRRP